MVFHQPDTTKCHCCDAINFGEPAPDCHDCGGTGRPAEKACSECGVVCPPTGSGYQHPRPPVGAANICPSASLLLAPDDVCPTGEPLTVEAKLALLRGCVQELPGTLLYYDLKDSDVDLTPADVVALQRGGHLTIEMLTKWFAEALKKDWPT